MEKWILTTSLSNQLALWLSESLLTGALERLYSLSFLSLTIQRTQHEVWVSQKFSLCPCQIQMLAKIDGE